MPERTSIESASGRRPSSDRAWRGAGAVGEEKLEKAHILGLALEVPVRERHERRYDKEEGVVHHPLSCAQHGDPTTCRVARACEGTRR